MALALLTSGYAEPTAAAPQKGTSTQFCLPRTAVLPHPSPCLPPPPHIRSRQVPRTPELIRRGVTAGGDLREAVTRMHIAPPPRLQPELTPAVSLVCHGLKSGPVSFRVRPWTAGPHTSNSRRGGGLS